MALTTIATVSHTQSGAITASRPRLRDSRQPLAAPACDVRDQYVLSEVQLGLVHGPPSARATTAETECVSQTGHETGFR